jgi:hypothetical protein
MDGWAIKDVSIPGKNYPGGGPALNHDPDRKRLCFLGHELHSMCHGWDGESVEGISRVQGRALGSSPGLIFPTKKR